MVNNCGNCKHREVEGYEEPCSSCRTTSDGTPTKWEQKHTTHTNADRIRAMSDDLLATQLAQVVKETIKALTELDLPEEILNEIRSNLLEKLKQPAEGE